MEEVSDVNGIENYFEEVQVTRKENVGWEPWSSGYGSRLMSEGHGFESQHHILDGHFSNIFVVQIIIMLAWRHVNKRKRGRDGPFF